MSDDDLVELEVLGVRRQAPLDQVVVLLLDLEGRRLLPIVVGLTEGTAIAAGQAGVVPPRPMTHDLLVSTLAATGVEVVRSEVVALVDGVFHAALVLDNGERVDARASDAIAVAVRTGSPVLCAPQVLEESGLAVEERAEEDEVEEFRAFLDQVSADDFVTGEDPGPPGAAPS
ncbi:bifunctional nuclease family protein [Actinotalea sp. AC32]|nr:bifunctional nuclease family protein [Actinotalea sp. AC32]